MTEQKTIAWTLPMRERFRKAYKLAIEHKRDSFVFDGNEFVTNYAKYLLQYLDTLPFEAPPSKDVH